MTGVGRGLKTGLRGLLRSPWILGSAVLCLALGIGANTALIDLADVLLFRPPEQVKNAGEVRRVYRRQPGESLLQGVFAYPVFHDLAEATGVFSSLAAYTQTEASSGHGQEAHRVRLKLVTANFFSLLGVQPVAGRLFAEPECDPERPALVALLSWEVWQRSYGGGDILGRAIPIGRQSYTVIGVLPRRFTGLDLEPVDIWLPVGAVGLLGAGAGWSQHRQYFLFNVIGRLCEGLADAQAEKLASLALQRAEGWPPDRAERIELGRSQWGWSPERRMTARLALWMVGASAAVFLLACGNVASLLTLRLVSRRSELAARFALGAGRGHLAGLLWRDSLLLSLIGGAAAWVAARLVEKLVSALLLPQGSAPAAFGTRFGAILGLGTVGAVLFTAVGPAWSLRHLRTSTFKLEGSRDRSRVQAILLVIQVGFTFSLLVEAGLFAKSLRNVRDLRLGLEPERVLVVTANLAEEGRSFQEVDAFYQQALQRVRSLHGVERASLTAAIPFRMSFGTMVFVPRRGEPSQLAPGDVYLNAVSEDYFSTLGTTLRQGRAFRAQDNAESERVGVINETMARLAWQGEDPLGKCFQLGSETAPCTTIVGVVENIRRARLQEPPTPQVYVPLTQAPQEIVSRALFVRAADPARFLGIVRREVAALAPHLPFIEVRRLADLVDPQMRPWRLGTTVLSVFGLLALVVAAVGIFATVGHAVASRTAELGIRKALGARFRELLWPVTKPCLGPAILGLALGLALVAGLGRFVEPLLFGVSAMDPAVISSAAFVLLGATLVAGLLPALRVRKIDPVHALRTDRR